jgi:SPP1 family predicted phage head-tail adaptor
MNSRSLNRRVTIQQQSASQDAVGQPVTTWSTLVTVNANVRYLNGLETLKADAVASISKASIRIRRRTNVTAKMRAVLGSTTFEIKAVLPDEQHKDFLDLACEVIA